MASNEELNDYLKRWRNANPQHKLTCHEVNDYVDEGIGIASNKEGRKVVDVQFRGSLVNNSRIIFQASDINSTKQFNKMMAKAEEDDIKK